MSDRNLPRAGRMDKDVGRFQYYGLGHPDGPSRLSPTHLYYLENPVLDQLLQNQADIRCRKIIDERMRMKEKMQNEAPKEWLNGVEDITIASYDMITVTLYYPTIGE